MTLREIAERLHEGCPCRRAQTHADSSVYGPCRDKACRCYYLGEGRDECVWPSHAAIEAALREVQATERARVIDELNRRIEAERDGLGNQQAMGVLELARNEIIRWQAEVQRGGKVCAVSR